MTFWRMTASADSAAGGSERSIIRIQEPRNRRASVRTHRHPSAPFLSPECEPPNALRVLDKLRIRQRPDPCQQLWEFFDGRLLNVVPQEHRVWAATRSPQTKNIACRLSFFRRSSSSGVYLR